MAATRSAEKRVEEAMEKLHDGMYPLEFFNDPEIHRLELERIFGKAWILIGHESEISEPGDYTRRYVGNDTFIFAKDENGDVNVLFDSCRHQGTKLCRAEQGNTSHFRCPYHGWTYNNKGELVGVPEKNEAFPNLDTDEYGLHHAPRTDSYQGLVFASLADDGPTLQEFLGEFTWYLDLMFELVDGGMEVIGQPHRWMPEANWKVGVDNFNGDSYHAPWAHRSISDVGLGGDNTNEITTTKEKYKAHRHVRCNGHSASWRGIRDDDIFLSYPSELRELITPDGLTDEQYELARKSPGWSGAIFPNLGFLYHGDLTDDPRKGKGPFFTIRKWRPVGPDTTEIWSWSFVPREAPEKYKERMNKIYTANFGPSGNFEQDDTPIWESITEMADSQMTRQHDLELNYQMGMEGMGKPPEDEDWPGPGTALRGDLEVSSIRMFHEYWAETLIEDALPMGESEI